jgi:hypothetical protein
MYMYVSVHVYVDMYVCVCVCKCPPVSYSYSSPPDELPHAWPTPEGSPHFDRAGLRAMQLERSWLFMRIFTGVELICVVRISTLVCYSGGVYVNV